MSSFSRRFLIRDRTSESHARVESLVGSFSTLASYSRYLQGTYAFRAGLESAMNGARQDSSVLGPAPELAPLIRLDLEDLGIAVPPAQPFGLGPSGQEDWLGAHYVVEGSTLGARILYKRAQQLGLSETFGARHLAAQSGSIERWKEVVRLLDESPELNLDRTVEAAEAVFAAVGRAFEELQDA